MKKKTLLILLIVACVGIFLLFVDSIYDLRNQIDMMQHLKESTSFQDKHIKARIPYLIETILGVFISLGTLILCIIIAIQLVRGEKLTLTQEEIEERKQERNQKRIEKLNNKIRKINKKDDK